MPSVGTLDRKSMDLLSAHPFFLIFRFDNESTLSSHGFVSAGKPLVEASYKMAYICAREKKPYSLVETVVKPCMIETAKLVLGEQAADKLRQVPTSANTIKERVDEISEDILQQVRVPNKFHEH